MSTLEIIASQVVISVVVALGVVALYHLLSSRNKQPAPPNPAPTLNLNPNLNLNLPSAPPAKPAALLAAPPLPPAPVPAPRPQSTPPEIVAVIAAAIAAVFGPHRVLAIQQVAAPAPEVNVWALEGRMKQFMSHKVR